MRLLPIHWATPPTPEDWAWLKNAKPDDFTDTIKPVNAVTGSVGRVLAIDAVPLDFPCDGALVFRTDAVHDVSDAMAWCLGLDRPGFFPTFDNREEVLSNWFQGPVKYVGEEEYNGPQDS